MVLIPALPSGYSLRMPSKDELVSECAADSRNLFIYGPYFKSGLTLPIHPLIKDLVDLAGIAPCQLQPNAYKILYAMIELFRRQNMCISVETVLKIYSLCRSQKRRDKISLHAMPGNRSLITKLPASERLWNTKPVILIGDAWGLAESTEPKAYVPKKSVIFGHYFFKFEKSPDEVRQIASLYELPEEQRAWTMLVTTLPEETDEGLKAARTCFFNVDRKYNYYDPQALTEPELMKIKRTGSSSSTIVGQRIKKPKTEATQQTVMATATPRRVTRQQTSLSQGACGGVHETVEASKGSKPFVVVEESSVRMTRAAIDKLEEEQETGRAMGYTEINKESVIPFSDGAKTEPSLNACNPEDMDEDGTDNPESSNAPPGSTPTGEDQTFAANGSYALLAALEKPIGEEEVTDYFKRLVEEQETLQVATLAKYPAAGAETATTVEELATVPTTSASVVTVDVPLLPPMAGGAKKEPKKDQMETEKLGAIPQALVLNTGSSSIAGTSAGAQGGSEGQGDAWEKAIGTSVVEKEEDPCAKIAKGYNMTDPPVPPAEVRIIPIKQSGSPVRTNDRLDYSGVAEALLDSITLPLDQAHIMEQSSNPNETWRDGVRNMLAGLLQMRTANRLYTEHEDQNRVNGELLNESREYAAKLEEELQVSRLELYESLKLSEERRVQVLEASKARDIAEAKFWKEKTKLLEEQSMLQNDFQKLSGELTSMKAENAALSKDHRELWGKRLAVYHTLCKERILRRNDGQQIGDLLQEVEMLQSKVDNLLSEKCEVNQLKIAAATAQRQAELATKTLKKFLSESPRIVPTLEGTEAFAFENFQRQTWHEEEATLRQHVVELQNMCDELSRKKEIEMKTFYESTLDEERVKNYYRGFAAGQSSGFRKNLQHQVTTVDEAELEHELHDLTLTLIDALQGTPTEAGTVILEELVALREIRGL